MTTMSAFIAKERIKMEAELTDQNPNMDSMPAGSTHWVCRFRRAGKRMSVHFSMGPAHSGEPKTDEVLDCLASDASSFENAGSFESWAGDYGYDTDSRKAERTYRAVEKQTAKLRAFLSPEAFETLLYKLDR